MVSVSWGGNPVSISGAVTAIRPPRPASPPASAMTMTVTRPTEIPAVAVAAGFRPTACSSRPNVVRSKSHQHAKAASRASPKPKCRRVPSIRGRVAFHSSTGAIGCLTSGCRMKGCIIR